MGCSVAATTQLYPRNKLFYPHTIFNDRSRIPVPAQHYNPWRREWKWRIVKASSSEKDTKADQRASSCREIRVCVNRTCAKSGSRETLNFFTGLAPPDVKVKSCGCLGHCGSGPNLVVLPAEIFVGHCGTASHAAHLLAIQCGASDPENNLTALSLKEQGNKEFESGNLVRAEQLFSQGFVNQTGSSHLEEVKELACIFHSSRSWTAFSSLPSHQRDYIAQGIQALQIAVKRLKVWSTKAEMEFAVEVEILGRVRHKNLLSLRGYCSEGQERLIVYDYMPNLSILSHLHGQHAAECLLDWSRRMNIAIGSAEGLAYLHHHATPHIIHRDIKASNVLLDSDFKAQVADFGFAKLIPEGETHVTTGVKGTVGYLAPEYAMWRKASENCDVYSFGILLLELVSGKKPVDKMDSNTKHTIVDWALPLVLEGKYDQLADPKFHGKYNEEELKRVVHVAIMCAQNAPEKRPTMLEVVDFLTGESKEKLFKMININIDKNENLDDGKCTKEMLEANGSSK